MAKMDFSEILLDVTRIAAIADKVQKTEAALPPDLPDVKKGTAIARAVFTDVLDLIDLIADQAKT